MPMIVVRNVFQAKFGKGGELAQHMARSMEGATAEGVRWRVLTDLSSGSFDTVVMEAETGSLAEWEERRARMFADPEFRQMQAATADLIESGHGALYTLEARGGE